MAINIHTEHINLVKGCRDIVRVFFPEQDISINEGEPNLYLELRQQGRAIWVRALSSQDGDVVADGEASDDVADMVEMENTSRRLARLAVFRCLAKATGKSMGPWGILTGIRPTKVVHRLLDQGMSLTQAEQILIHKYALAQDKSKLLTEVCGHQRRFLHAPAEAGRRLSVYIGIPFCPTRCLYCSFPAYSLEKWGGLVEPFLQALLHEVSTIGQTIKNSGLIVETVYVGGGTPTSLDAISLHALLEAVNQNIITKDTVEFTVEAGRPDSIDLAKLYTMKEWGVNRISINPQTMRAETLRTIGRCHSPEDVAEVMTMARKVGFENINMDVIVGLPGEQVEDVAYTLEALEKLRPENLTVHTLAVKRASRLKEEQRKKGLYEGNLLDPHRQIGAMQELVYQSARGWGMHPYYLYRQKQMLGPLENVGLALEGKDCVYNIQMMEERQTIVGLGAGAGSKWVDPGDWTLLNTYNPKDPQNYVERIERLVKYKVDKLTNPAPLSTMESSLHN